MIVSLYMVVCFADGAVVVTDRCLEVVKDYLSVSSSSVL